MSKTPENEDIFVKLVTTTIDFMEKLFSDIDDIQKDLKKLS